MNQKIKQKTYKSDEEEEHGKYDTKHLIDSINAVDEIFRNKTWILPSFLNTCGRTSEQWGDLGKK